MIGLSASEWEALALRRHELARVLGRWAESLKRAALDVEDVVQEALVRAWRFRDRFDASRSSAWGWLCMIAHRAASKVARGGDTAKQRASVRCAWHGPVPFGFRNVDGVLVPDEKEQRVLADARTMLKSGQSMRAVVRELDARGVRTRSGKPFARASLESALARAA